ncbi:cell division protein FtsQ/DivIB [Palleronia caenipelagi]|uniref:Cell division protein FtsQ n=1 Tax=Palleronia caenipelagi TaxID=2489174 RepID=A0A547QAQ4_9RHOB|nr:cell division protein FtsQ/DivIB [Palleronia caenipelagi]TRD23462.1 cell division protein FtsQ [Palleronia caenipelagi]
MRSLTHPRGYRDPAPSRLSYRLHRLALTPHLRRAFVLGGPLVAAALVLTLIFADLERRAAMVSWYHGVVDQIQNRKEFAVNTVSINGALDPLADEIRARMDLRFPVSSFDLDLEAMRAQVEALDAVESAHLRIRKGGVLDIAVTQRVPAMIWRTRTGLQLLDAEGNRVSSLGFRDERADLPLISGYGADRAVPEALQLYAAARPVLPRIRGLVRIGERRWDLVLSEGQKVKLPEDNPVRALEQVLAIDEAEELLSRQVVLVDMRMPRRPTVRLKPKSAEVSRDERVQQLGEK